EVEAFGCAEHAGVEGVALVAAAPDVDRAGADDDVVVGDGETVFADDEAGATSGALVAAVLRVDEGAAGLELDHSLLHLLEADGRAGFGGRAARGREEAAAGERECETAGCEGARERPPAGPCGACRGAGHGGSSLPVSDWGVPGGRGGDAGGAGGGRGCVRAEDPPEIPPGRAAAATRLAAAESPRRQERGSCREENCDECDPGEDELGAGLCQSGVSGRRC